MSITDWSIVVVTHNSAAVLREVWMSVSPAVRDRVICVDNGSADDTVQVAEQLFPIVVRSANAGLSKGNNLGALRSTTHYILFCNPDVAPVEEDFAQLSSHLDTHGGLASPRLVNTDLTPQENARGWPVFARQLLNRFTKLNDPAYLWPVHAISNSPVPWVLGATVAMTRSTFRRLRGWPEEYFLYYEDVELCCRAWDEGEAVWVLGNVTWVHKWQRSSRRPLSKSARMHYVSAIRFFVNRPTFLLRVPRQFVRRLQLAGK